MARNSIAPECGHSVSNVHLPTHFHLTTYVSHDVYDSLLGYISKNQIKQNIIIVVIVDKRFNTKKGHILPAIYLSGIGVVLLIY